MSHGVHAVQHEVEHRLEHETGHEDGGDSEHGAGAINKKVALLIAVIALVLAFSETLGKSAQTNAISLNVEASNLWAFFQAKTIRQTVLRTASDILTLDADAIASDIAVKSAIAKQVGAWRGAAQRYETEPETGEGRKELAVRAKKAEEKRDVSLARYHHYEMASAAFQIGIVLASATVITGMVILSYLAGGLGIVGLGFMGIGLLAPHAVHIF